MMDTNIPSRASSIKPMKGSRDMGPLIPFDELVTETEVGADSPQQDENCSNNTLEDCTLPDPCTLLHVTNRRKVPLRKKSLLEVCTILFMNKASLIQASLICFLVSGQ